jgi:hypothetical protein
LVADIQLLTAATIWGFSTYLGSNMNDAVMVIVSLSGGALMANFVSVILFIGDTLKSKR